MNILNRLYGWYGKRTVFILFSVIVVLLIIGVVIHFFVSSEGGEIVTEDTIPVVTVASVATLQSESAFEVTGTVRAISEARLQFEASGRITSVNVALGDSVAQGAILASIENRAQSAALLQAEGAYDAALANAESSESSADTAQNDLEAALFGAITTYKSAFISADSAVRNTIDDLFTDPTAPIPGFRLDGFGNAPALNAERLALEPILDVWSADVNTVQEVNVEARLDDAIATVERIAVYTENLAAIVSRQDTGSSFTEVQKDALEAEFLSMRSSLNQTLLALKSAKNGISDARESLQRAQITSTGSGTSLASAQLKSALGTLRAAQAAYEKTLVRSPIRGVVNALYVVEGTYANMGTPAAVIANNNALEISTYLSDEDTDLISIGDVVTVQEGVEGVITQIAPAIDPLTGKKEIKLSVSDDTALTNGDTVTIIFKRSEEKEQDKITIPLSALKMTATGALIFTVSEENTLVEHEIELGTILGDMVEVTQGLSKDTRIVVDARGLEVGELVELTN